MKIETHACDVCQLQRQSTNHWWLVYRLVGGGALLAEWDNALWEKGVLTPEAVISDEPAHLCGIQHVLEYLSRNVLEVKT